MSRLKKIDTTLKSPKMIMTFNRFLTKIIVFLVGLAFSLICVAALSDVWSYTSLILCIFAIFCAIASLFLFYFSPSFKKENKAIFTSHLMELISCILCCGSFVILRWINYSLDGSFLRVFIRMTSYLGITFCVLAIVYQGYALKREAFLNKANETFNQQQQSYKSYYKEETKKPEFNQDNVIVVEVVDKK